MLSCWDDQICCRCGWSQAITCRTTVLTSVHWKNEWIFDGHFFTLVTYYDVPGYACGIVKRHTPFLYSTTVRQVFCTYSPFFIQVMSGWGSHWTMHSKRADWPLTAAMSFRGYKSFGLRMQLNLSREMGRIKGLTVIKSGGRFGPSGSCWFTTFTNKTDCVFGVVRKLCCWLQELSGITIGFELKN